MSDLPFVLRPSEERDLPALKRLVATISGNVTSLPNEDALLENKVLRSGRAFDRRVRGAGDDHYFFVLEHTNTGEVVGTCGIGARVGGFDPFYSYEIRRERFSHPALAVEKELRVLHLKTDHKGPSELCSLYLRPDCRRAGVGRLLSLGRFLFMDAFRPRFESRVIAELRGWLDAEHRSPFWESVGRHFFERDFLAADFLSGLGEKDFIRDLMPRHPIYLALLPTAVQEVVGRVHPDAEPAWRLLINEGFQPGDEVDIFDAGPLLSARLADVRTVRECRRAPLRGTWESEGSFPVANAPLFLLSNDCLEFRACLGVPYVHEDNSVSLPTPVAARLGLRAGDVVCFAPAHPAREVPVLPPSAPLAEVLAPLPIHAHTARV